MVEHTPGPKHPLKTGRPLEPLIIPQDLSCEQAMELFGRSGYSARRLSEAAQTWQNMLEAEAMVALTVAGALTPIGMGGIIGQLLEQGMVDFIISTGANLYHDLHFALDYPVVQGHFNTDDRALAKEGVARIHDVFIGDEDTLVATDIKVQEWLDDFEPDGPISTAQLHHELGARAAREAPHPERSLVVKAHELGVPLYVASPGDSSLGMNLLPRLLEGRPIHIDPSLDILETAALVNGSEVNGVIVLGGGAPKNFYLQTQPTLWQILGLDRGGHDHYIQITMDQPHWGGLSGATPAEAHTWGKLADPHLNNTVVHCDTSIALPLLAATVMERCEPRPVKRLYDKRDGLVADLVGDWRAGQPHDNDHPIQ